MRYLIIDERMRGIEKEKLKSLGYELIEINKNENLYSEISSHVDIFACKIKDKIIVENGLYKTLKSKLKNADFIINGTSNVYGGYPDDIKYNVCIVGNKAIHNFKYTDIKLKKEIKENNLELIDVKQGYSNCSIAVIDDNSIILSDKGLNKTLENKGLDILFLDYTPDIKLLTENNKYSKKNGFVGGAISKIQNNIIVFGDLSKIDINNKIKNFILSKNLKIVDFKGLDVIDYGGIIEI